MFYTKLIKLCEEYGEKPTPVLKKLNISPGNLKRWENGAAVNSDTLTKIADYFNVPVDYFFTEEDEVAEIVDDDNSVRKIYSIFRAYPDYIASLLTGASVSADELKTVAAYLNCSTDYLLNGAENEPLSSSQAPVASFLSPKDLTLEILSRLASNKDYRALQVNISRIIINNLAKLNITQDKLLSIKLYSKKINDLYDRDKPIASLRGLNNSDLIRISRAFGVAFEFMFTGRN